MSDQVPDQLWKHSIFCAYRDGDPCTCKELPEERAVDEDARVPPSKEER